MSLIDEALKRARLDAARQAGAADHPRGGFASPWSHMPAAPGGRRQGARRIALGAAMAVSLLIGGTGILLSVRSAGRGAGAGTRATGNGAPPAPGHRLTSDRSGLDEASRGERDERAGVGERAGRDERARRNGRMLDDGRGGREPRVAAAPRNAGADSARSSVGPPAVVDGSATGTALAGAASPAASEAGTAGREPAAVATDPPATATEGAGAPASPAGSGAAATTAPAAGAAAAGVVADGGTYTGVARLADGSTLQLSGIAWSDASPAALINGRVLGTGESLGDVTVDKIEPHRVTLRHRSGALFYMRVK
jgi:hypothetical protein